LVFTPRGSLPTCVPFTKKRTPCAPVSTASAGEEGGRVVAAGPPAVVAQAPESRTAFYLARELG
jgi:hypothetical protein